MKYLRPFTSIFTLLILFSTSAQKEIKVENTTDGTFRQKSVRSLNWMNDGQFYSALSDNKIIKYSVRTGEEVETIVDGNSIDLDIDSYSFSDEESLVLIMTDRKSIYRRSYTAVFYLYDRNTKEVQKLADGRQSYATISPDNSKVAFTRDNNLFYVDLSSEEEIAVTTDGKFNYIINGSTDWVYEEELYLTKAFAWSPDSKRLAYYRMDESDVKEYNMQVWNEGALYPEDYRYKYPKAGEENSIVEIYLYELASAEKVKADIGEETDIYIPRIYWTKNPELLAIQRLNRLQNQLDILHVNTKTGESKIILTDKSDTYIHFTFCDDLTYLDNGTQFIYSSEKSGYKHYYLYNLDGSLENQITKGSFEASSMVGLDQKKNKLYYISTEDSPLERQLYVVSLSGKGKKKLTNKAGYSYVDMSEDCSFYMNYFSSAETPLVVSLYQTSGNKRVKVMEDNQELSQKIKEYGFADKEFFQLTNATGSTLSGFFLKPEDFDENKKYPLLIYQYSGPGSQNVANRWGGGHFIWHQYLAQEGYVVAFIDTRGTGARGEAYKKLTYKQLGKYETEDLISSASTLADYDYIDEDRIGIWGWSYGGYLSSLAILKGNDVFKTAIAVAPVTTWRYYDTIYTERYLQKPQENPSGYDDNSPNSHAEKLKGNFLLVHGTGDDNVHFQNSVALQDELLNAGKQFDSFYYPDRAHSLGNRRGHLYQMMTDFLMEKL
ncbi:DPP IV N-terminal domain-containing protein [Ekhidna sp.]|uniref:DPP IV N-terminal domain-containing protein n=1 Tax=Ekhidna sp. TaxID=2608089 RepID=UPI003CCBE323